MSRNFDYITVDSENPDNMNTTLNLDNMALSQICSTVELPSVICKPSENSLLQAHCIPGNLWPDNYRKDYQCVEIKLPLIIKFMNNKPPLLPYQPFWFWEKSINTFFHHNTQSILAAARAAGLEVDPLEEVYSSDKFNTEKLLNIDGLLPVLIKHIITTRFIDDLKLGLDIVFLDYRENDTRKSDIRIIFEHNKGCHSWIGTEATLASQNQPTMTFSWFSVQTVLHEFCHALGMVHEHQVEDLPWNKKLIYANYMTTNGWDQNQVDDNIFYQYNYSANNDFGGVYDPKSIMHYRFGGIFFTDGKDRYGGFCLSEKDRYWLNHWYPPSIDPPNCSGKQCGDDGNGNSCGVCDTTKSCQNNQCIACPTQRPDNIQCGIDICLKDWPCDDTKKVCNNNTCIVCIPDCKDKKCGDDGCGGSCGVACASDERCINNNCLKCPTQRPANIECGKDICNNTWFCDDNTKVCDNNNKCININKIEIKESFSIKKNQKTYLYIIIIIILIFLIILWLLVSKNKNIK